jgi:predicted DNA-binding ribbon-helix-helix protein
MTSLVLRSVAISQARSAIRLEAELWDGLREVCRRERWSEWQAIGVAQGVFPDTPRTSAVRSYLMLYFRTAVTAAGHEAAAHGVG